MSTTPPIRTRVVRLSGRAYRDLRITTHTCLVSRAFGAEKIILDYEQSEEIGKTVSKINQTFGGTFSVEYSDHPLNEIKKMKKEGWGVVHLTMYGEPMPRKMTFIRKMRKPILIVVGAEKVPGEVYHIADCNISCTRQPHSEVAALAVFLHELNKGNEETMEWEGGSRRIIPQKIGKKVVDKN